MTGANAIQSEITDVHIVDVTQDAFNQNILTLFKGSGLPSKIAVAVSGGVDSMALCYLMQSFCADHKIELYTFTVDHGLRAESADEAQWVKKTLDDDSIHCDVLAVNMVAGSAVQERARDARFDALETACQKYNIQTLCTAHHEGDLRESFFYRLISGSGLVGLSSISHGLKRKENLTLLKPLLSFNKKELRNFIKSKNKDNIEDSSNIKPLYTRNRLRSLLSGFSNALEKEGLSLKRLKSVLMRLSRADKALDFYAVDAEKNSVEKLSWGGILINRVTLLSYPDETIIRVLQRALAYSAPHHDYSKLSAIEDIVMKIQEQASARLTLLGCVIDWNDREITIGRECDAIEEPDLIALTVGEAILWDHRFRFSNEGAQAHAIRAYQDRDAAHIKAIYGDQSLSDIQPIFRYGLPVIVDADDICIYAPWLGANNPEIAVCFSLLSDEKHLD